MIGETDGPAAGLDYLSTLDGPPARRFQPAWATRAHLLAGVGDAAGARMAFDKAISLTTDAPSRNYLVRQRAGLAAPPP